MTAKSSSPLKAVTFISIFVIASLLGAIFGVFLSDNLSQAATPTVSNIYPAVAPINESTEFFVEGTNFQDGVFSNLETTTTGDVIVNGVSTHTYYDNDLNQDVTDTFIVGSFSGTFGFGGTPITSKGGYDGFIARVSEGFSQISWIRGIGGTGFDTVTNVKANWVGESYLSGYFESPSVEVYQVSNTISTMNTNAASSSFISSFSKFGQHRWSTNSNGGDSVANSVELDENRDPFITGSFDGITTISNETLTSNGAQDYYVAKFDQTTGASTASFSNGGGGNDVGQDVAIDTAGNVYVSGNHNSTFTVGSDTLIAPIGGGSNGFVSKYNSTGTGIWAKESVYANSGAGNSQINNVEYDEDEDSVYISNNGFGDLTLTGDVTNSSSDDQAILAKYDNAGVFQWSNQIDGAGLDEVTDILIWRNGGTPIISGIFENSSSVETQEKINLNQNLASQSISSVGGVDAFWARYARDGQLNQVVPFGGAGTDNLQGVDRDHNSRPVLAGDFTGNTSFYTENLTTTGTDAFVVKYDPGQLYVEIDGDQVNAIAVSPQLLRGFSGHVFSGPGPTAGTYDLEIFNGDGTSANTPNAFTYFDNGDITGQTLTFGLGDSGQDGHGTSGDTSKPRSLSIDALAGVPVVGGNISAAAGDNHTIVLLDDGSVMAWGDNSSGQLGLGDFVDRDTPQPVSIGLGNSTTKVFTGKNHSFALVNNTDIWAWGDNDEGQLGNGNTIDQNTPVQISYPPLNPAENIWQIAGGDNFSGFITTFGRVFTWGNNDYGQLGHGTVGTNVLTPTLFATPVQGQTLRAGSSHFLFKNTSNQVLGWGRNHQGQLGNGTVTPFEQAPVTAIGLSAGIQDLAAGADYSMALDTTTGNIWTWGDNSSGQLGNGTIGGNSPTPINIDTPTLPEFTMISAGGYSGGPAHALALDELGIPYSWGDSDNGQGGRGTSPSYVPQSIGSISPYVVGIVETGGQHSVIANEGGDPAPVAVDDFPVLVEDGGPQDIDVLANDSDIDCSGGGGGGGPAAFLNQLFNNIEVSAQCGPPTGCPPNCALSNGLSPLALDVATVQIISDVSNGTITGINNTNGFVSYEPNTNFNGMDSFTYVVNDDNGSNSNIATVNITVTPQALPQAVDDLVSTPEGVSISIDVIDNDIDADHTLQVCTNNGYTQPDDGIVNLDSNGNLIYTPDEGFTGTDTFTYFACETAPGNGQSPNAATVTVSVTPLSGNQNPDAIDDNVSVDENGTLSVPVLDNDVDPDSGDVLSICTPNGFTQGANGTVTQSGDNLIYTPNTGYTGSDTFTYRACDGNGGEDTANVNVTVNPLVNQPPVIQNQTIIVKKGQANSFNGYAATDPENNTPITFTTSAIEPKLNCTQSDPGNTGNIVTCSPDLDLPVGVYTFTVTPRDSQGLDGNSATFTIDVQNPDNVNLVLFKDKADNTVKINDVVTVEANISNPNGFTLFDVQTTLTLDESKIEINDNSAKAGTISGDKFSSLFELSGYAMVDTFEYIGDNQIRITIPELEANQTREFVFTVTAQDTGIGDINGSTIINSIPGIEPAVDDTNIPVSTVITSVLPRTGGSIAATLIITATIITLGVTLVSNKKS